MRIAMVTSGRFTLVDLARELEHMGHQTQVYSLVPPHLTARFGLPSHANRWLGLLAAPAYGATKLLRSGDSQSIAQHALNVSIDLAAAHKLEACDIIVGMSGIALRVLDTARRRFGALVVLQRSSQHILSQREILDALEGPRDVQSVPQWAVERELAGYGLADVISVPSSEVLRSFLERGAPADRLFTNPFGAEIDVFEPTTAPAGNKTIIMVGAWSRQKGCDLLADACRELGDVRLLHLGPLGDAPVPSEDWFEHVGTVPQNDLPKYYAQAHVFALSSRQEGMPVVLLQAMACGVPIVCTTRTGGGDLRELASDPDMVDVVPPDDVPALTGALRAMFARMAAPGTKRRLLSDRRGVSWEMHARRFEQEMLRRLDQRRLDGAQAPTDSP